ncbi:terpenoid cyclases/Protein prenyltransferase [Ceratobasidium sp. AG-I]|nr:terpenoid cyclases/Protein prenyltransferase [Ceratobasidium sp. AG-I]
MSLKPFLRKAHVTMSYRCLTGLGSSAVQADDSRMAIAFYALASLDLYGEAISQPNEGDRDGWRRWIWARSITTPNETGFRGGDSLLDANAETSITDPANLIMTYAAILSLAILRDDFSQLDRAGLRKFVGSCQNPDGSFSATVNGDEGDLRVLYTAFVICFLLDDWEPINIPAAVDYIRRCRTYEGGYGQSPDQEAHGGPTYCAIAAMSLCPSIEAAGLDAKSRQQTIRWLSGHQTTGFCGRTGKTPDSCYSFWCGATLKILGAEDVVDVDANAAFIAQCQFKFGGLAKVPDDRPDPLHSYLSIASLALYPPTIGDESWIMQPLVPALNAEESTARWAIEHIRNRPAQ